MRENICLQCKKLPSGPSNRLVQDSCGHKKCRTCLLEDEEQCKQCDVETENSENGIENGSVDTDDVEGSDIVEYERNGDTPVFNNHTGVIQVNGSVPNSGAKLVSSIASDIVGDYNFAAANKSSDNNRENIVREDGECGTSAIKKSDKSIEKKSHRPIDIPKHIAVISDPPSYHCNICDKTFITKTHVKYHSYCAGGKV